MLIRYFHVSIVECSVYVLVFRNSNNFLCGGRLFIWSSSLTRRIVHIISMQDIYHNFLCNRWFSRLAKILDCKDCYFPYYLSCLTLGLFCESLSATSWGYLLHVVMHMSCVIKNCVRHQ